ncbi:MAG: hypothetical protein M0024_05870 [Nitrospiraceae bacterium]|nr:hypothetical protein [Nitrospiraceae bacterium]
MKRYILREYGSWGVMTIAYIAGLIAGRSIGIKALAGYICIALLINSKQAFTLWMRGPKQGTMPLLIFLAQALPAAAALAWLTGGQVLQLLPYAVVPAAYLASLKALGEHSIYTEVLGFSLLSLSGLIAKFSETGVADPVLYLTIALFFIAGVFRVRIQFRKETKYRVIMAAYVVLALGLYAAAGVPLYILLPLADNVIFAIFLYRVGLSGTGWIEMSKGAAFLCLMAYGYT